MIFQSTLPARGATDYFTSCLPAPQFQSTLPARGATWYRGRDRMGKRGFQSTLPARGATDSVEHHRLADSISIHAPREGSDPADGLLHPRRPEISIHAPREGSDVDLRDGPLAGVISIHAPREGSDRRRRQGVQHQSISIHAPREGSDCQFWIFVIHWHEFQSTLPARGATNQERPFYGGREFQSTLPARGATCLPSWPHL